MKKQIRCRLARVLHAAFFKPTRLAFGFGLTSIGSCAISVPWLGQRRQRGDKMGIYSDDEKAAILAIARATVERLENQPASYVPPSESPSVRWRREQTEAEANRERERALDRAMTDHVRAKLSEASTDWQARIDQAVAAEHAFWTEALPELIALVRQQITSEIEEKVGLLRADVNMQRAIDKGDNITELPSFLRKTP